MSSYYSDHPSAERPLEIELIRQATREASSMNKRPIGHDWTDPKDAFIIKSANKWLAETPQQGAIKRLFGNFWFEGELCIMFADTNVGKSILAVQIGQSISSGQRIQQFEMEAEASPVLYFDFELSMRQFEQRYSINGREKFQFSERFFRVEPNPASPGASRFKTYSEYLANALENSLITTKVRILIIDNLSCLRRGTEGASAALKLMQLLLGLRNKYKLSILVLAHTPKRNPSRPISRNDLLGSKVLINFCDSAFAIGESQTQPGTRYLKQIKQRSTAETFGASQVCLCRIVTLHNFLCMDFMGHANENDHLLHYTEIQRHAMEQKVAELNAEGLSYRQIADRLKVSAATVGRMLKRLEEASTHPAP